MALKVINTERLDADGLDWLKREFRVIAGLRHPQIAAAYDFGYTESGQRPFYTREYVEGERLAAGPPGLVGQSDPQRFLQPIVDLLDALHYLHAHEILHLDIHAGNLIVARLASRGAVLIDFGLLRRSLGALRSSVDSGFPSRPPELLCREEIGPRTDLYAAGRLLLYRLTGRYSGESKLPREIPGWGPRLTLELERIVAKALESAPENRFQSALEFRAALADCLGQRPGRVPAVEPGELTVGRDSELEVIDAALDDAARGATPAIWFVGPTGIGKSRLLTEARWRAQLRGIGVVHVRFESGATTLAAALRTVREGADAARSPPSWLSPLSREHGGSTGERAAKTAQAYFATDGPPLVLLLDDLHGADRESRLLAEALLAECLRREVEARRGRGLAIIVAATSGPRRSAMSAAVRSSVRRLKPLTRSHAADLLERLLRPLAAPRRLLERLARDGRGQPLRLRQLAHSLHGEFGPAGRIPAEAVAPVLPPPGAASDLKGKDDDQLRLLDVLAVIQRPADRHELAAGSGLAPRDVTKALRKLTRTEHVAPVLAPSRRSGARLYYPTDPGTAAELAARVSARERTRIHERIIETLRGLERPTTRQRECLARHLLAAGKQRQGREAAFETARLLCSRGQLSQALRLLEDTAATETSRRSRLTLAEWISDLYGQDGDHLEGIAALEPVFLETEPSLTTAQTVRICRRLGVHHHRAGHPEAAASLFRKALRLARSDRDREELVFVHSELAELHTLQGDYESAENACRAGLELLESADSTSSGFRGDMEVTLRATLAHLELRRLNLKRSRDEFEAALELTHSHGTVGLRALILNNLGIVYNQLDEYSRARRCFETAERLLEAAGERHALIHIACNLAVMAAKQGKESRARAELEKASRHLREHPGERLEFFLALSRAVTEHHVGAMEAAAEGFLRALPLGRKFGDSYLVSFGEVYLAEAQIACGRYLDALKVLRGTASRARRGGPPVLQRMAAARLILAGRLLGDEGIVKRASKTLAEVPRTAIVLLEAWNDLCLACCEVLEAAVESPVGPGTAPPPSSGFEASREVFGALGVVAGARFARLGLLGGAMRNGNTDDIRRLLGQIERSDPSAHRFLRVVEPLVSAEACFSLGDLDRCDQHLQKASTATVGLPFLELDWRIEFQRARLAERHGDREGARHHLHRALQARDFLARTLPAEWRRKLLEQPRFRHLEEYRSRLERVERTRSTPLRLGAREYHGMVGASPAMRRVFEQIEELGDVDIAVLIRGDTGTGKELVARAIHASGPRRKGAFHSLHCASLPAELFESELFGYEAGAFTGADESRTGLLEHLAGGTLLLDGITHLSPRTQAKLLQVIDTRTARPLGSLSVRPVDIRFLASTTADVDTAISRGELREDLYYRLRAVEIELPPLRRRLEDLPALANHFLRLHGRRLERTPPRLSPQALLVLGEHPWPGNVRELEALMIRLLVTSSPGSTIETEPLRELLTPRHSSRLFADELFEGRELGELRRELEKAYLERLFHKTGGDIKKMVARLGIQRSNLYTWFRRVGIDVRELRGK